MSQPEVGPIEAAIIAAIQASAALSYVPDEQVQPVSERTVDLESVEILVSPPAVLTWYLGGQYDPTTVDAHQYAASERFLLIAVAENLRGTAEARSGALGDKGVFEMLADLKDLFAGLKLAIGDTRPITCWLVGTTVEGRTREGYHCYGLEIEFRGPWDNAS